jgi:hypothetical protein
VLSGYSDSAQELAVYVGALALLDLSTELTSLIHLGDREDVGGDLFH